MKSLQIFKKQFSVCVRYYILCALKAQGQSHPHNSPRSYQTLSLVLSFLLVISSHAQPIQTGTASYYTRESCKREGTSGIYTASGERYNENALTCAMRSRGFGKYYRVTNLANSKSVIVRHNDFGPSKKLHNAGRIIDLSKAAFAKIANLKQGVIPIEIEVVND